MAKAKTRSAKRTSKRALKRAVAQVSAWQDDPLCGLKTLLQPVPDLSKVPLRYRFKGAAVKPGVYAPGTAQFRYWSAAEALRRGGDF